MIAQESAPLIRKGTSDPVTSVSSRAQRGIFVWRCERSLAALGMTQSAAIGPSVSFPRDAIGVARSQHHADSVQALAAQRAGGAVAGEWWLHLHHQRRDDPPALGRDRGRADR